MKIEDVDIIKLLANKHRINILRSIQQLKKEKCVNEIAYEVGISQSLASHQLRVLSKAGVVVGKRKGKIICYAPAKTTVAQKVFRIINLL